MRFEPLPIAGAYRVRTEPRADARGSFVRIFCEAQFAGPLAGARWVQCNLSHTLARGTVRGLHYQRGAAAEIKLVRPLSGAVWDVLVDLREGSPTRGCWHALPLVAGEQTEVLIPPGVAHGFQALRENTQLLYFHSQPYSPEHEAGVRVDDPRLGIAWPLPIQGLSPRDANFALLEECLEGVAA